MRWFILLAVISIFACQRKSLPSLEARTEAAQDTFVVELDSLPPQDTILDRITPPPPPDTLLFFKRSSCFGKCPAYDLSIWTDGSAHYHGRAHTELLGDWSCSIDSSDLSHIMKWIKVYDLDTLSPSYPKDPEAWIPDLPSTTLIWKMNGQSGMIFHNHSAPQPYRNLEKMIDLWIGERNWASVPESLQN